MCRLQVSNLERSTHRVLNVVIGTPKTSSRLGRNVQVKFYFTTEAQKYFEKLKIDVNELKVRIDKHIIDISKLKPILNKLIESCQNYQIVEHYDDLAVCRTF